jgi:hypothetical protein
VTTDVGEHSAPEPGLLERWKQTEPLRLYLYGVTVPLLGVALVYGWVNAEQLGAWLAVSGALFIGSSVAGELARRKVTPVEGPVLGAWLEEQHRDSYTRGVEDALHVTPDATAELRQVTPETTELRQVRPSRGTCGYIESGRRCVLDRHGRETPHHYG